jgi:hypothetical protein
MPRIPCRIPQATEWLKYQLTQNASTIQMIPAILHPQLTLLLLLLLAIFILLGLGFAVFLVRPSSLRELVEVDARHHSRLTVRTIAARRALIAD